MINQLVDLIPQALLKKSGSVLYSGRTAFSNPASLYVLGVNPGGDPNTQAGETVEWHTSKVLNVHPASWSAYQHESWRNAAPGTCGMQPRVLHMFRQVRLEPSNVPASNVVFLRSSRESTIDGAMKQLADQCWQFHQAVIDLLGVRVVLCFGKTAGKIVCDRLSAHEQYAEFVEQNNRRWTSHAYVNHIGQKVIVATHPSIADWTNPASDPTGLVVDAVAMAA